MDLATLPLASRGGTAFPAMSSFCATAMIAAITRGTRLNESGIRPRRQRLAAQRQFETPYAGGLGRDRCRDRRVDPVVYGQALKLCAAATFLRNHSGQRQLPPR